MMPHFSGNANPPLDIKSWLKCQGNGKTLDEAMTFLPHDIYAVGTQVFMDLKCFIRLVKILFDLFPYIISGC